MEDTIVVPDVQQVSKEDLDSAIANDKMIFTLRGSDAILQNMMLQNMGQDGFALSLDFEDNHNAAVKGLIEDFLGEQHLSFKIKNGDSTMQFSNVEVTAMYGFKNFSLKTFDQPTIV